VSAARTSAILVRLYPPRWRDRYGDELAALIVESSGGRVPWRVGLDVAVGALRERGRSVLGWSDGSPRETVASALSSVLRAWLLVVVGGCIVAKASEHWQAATPAGSRALPAYAFDVLVAAAIAGTVIVVAGAALALPAVARCLRGESRQLRRPLAFAAGSTVALGLATVGLAAWAHGLSSAQRNGHDGAYGGAFVACVALFVVCLGAWTHLGARLGRMADLNAALLRVEAGLSGAAAAAMGLITVAGVVWWAAVADSAPWYFRGGAPGSSGTAVTWPLVVAGLLMLAGTLLAAGSAVRALRAAPALRAGERR
jgi:hypothetical protein